MTEILRLDDPRIQEMCLGFVATAENSNLDWRAAYDYIEDIKDGRGYTGGLVGFTSATEDMEALVRHYSRLNPGNALERFLPALAEISAEPKDRKRNKLSHKVLDPLGFTDAWVHEARTQPLFRQAQREERDRVYWRPALDQAAADGVSNVGLLVYFDVLVNHGPGSDPESFGGILATARAGGPAPRGGGDEAAYLHRVIDARWDVLVSWDDAQKDGRVPALRALVDARNPALVPPISWTMYGTRFGYDAYPVPRAE